jgi:hypothetical protein
LAVFLESALISRGLSAQVIDYVLFILFLFAVQLREIGCGPTQPANSDLFTRS